MSVEGSQPDDDAELFTNIMYKNRVFLQGYRQMCYHIQTLHTLIRTRTTPLALARVYIECIHSHEVTISCVEIMMFAH